MRIMRILCAQERGVSARELSRLTGVARPAILNAITELEAQGVLHKEESGGQFICRANRQHILYHNVLKPIFSAEADWTQKFFKEVRAAVATPKPVAVWIFGSVAEGSDRPGSDVDLFVLAHTSSDGQKLETRLHEQLPAWRQHFGLSVSPFVMTEKRAVTQRRAGDPLLENAVANGRMIVGQIPHVLLKHTTGTKHDPAYKKQARR